jgi:hypothetical protein
MAKKLTENPKGRRPGRPRSPARTALIEALTRKQDAMARRVARQIDEILKTHVSLEGARLGFHAICGRARQQFASFPDRAMARLSHPDTVDPRTVHRVLSELIDDALSELPPAPPGDGANIEAEEYEEPPPTVVPSRSLVAARAQLASLQTRLVETKARIYRGDVHAALFGETP